MKELVSGGRCDGYSCYDRSMNLTCDGRGVVQIGLAVKPPYQKSSILVAVYPMTCVSSSI